MSSRFGHVAMRARRWLTGWLAGHSTASRLVIRFARYTGGSLVALTTSEMVLVLCYATGIFGTTGSAITAFCAGAIPNYLLNRRWVWQRRGRPRVGREILLYLAVSGVSLLASVAATGWAVHTVRGSASTRTIVAAAAYLVTYGVLFVAKFAVFEAIVFTEHRPGTPDEECAIPSHREASPPLP
jgi:putative flippase GtrA